MKKNPRLKLCEKFAKRVIVVVRDKEQYNCIEAESLNLFDGEEFEEEKRIFLIGDLKGSK